MRTMWNFGDLTGDKFEKTLPFRHCFDELESLGSQKFVFCKISELSCVRLFHTSGCKGPAKVANTLYHDKMKETQKSGN